MAGSKQARPANRGQSQGSGNGREPQAQGKQGGGKQPPSKQAASQQARGQQPAAGRPASQADSARPAAAAKDIAAEPTATDPRWLQYSAWALSVAGLGVSIYLTIAHYTSSAILACSESGLVNCSKVTTSPESNVFGIFPVAVLGLAFFVFMVAVNSPWAWRSRQPLIPMARLASVLIGIVFVLYLVYTELFTLNAICLYCTAVHVITFLLFGLVMFSAATRTAPAARPRG